MPWRPTAHIPEGLRPADDETTWPGGWETGNLLVFACFCHRRKPGAFRVEQARARPSAAVRGVATRKARCLPTFRSPPKACVAAVDHCHSGNSSTAHSWCVSGLGRAELPYRGVLAVVLRQGLEAVSRSQTRLRTGLQTRLLYSAWPSPCLGIPYTVFVPKSLSARPRLLEAPLSSLFGIDSAAGKTALDGGNCDISFASSWS